MGNVKITKVSFNAESKVVVLAVDQPLPADAGRFAFYSSCAADFGYTIGRPDGKDSKDAQVPDWLLRLAAAAFTKERQSFFTLVLAEGAEVELVAIHPEATLEHVLSFFSSSSAVTAPQASKENQLTRLKEVLQEIMNAPDQPDEPKAQG